MSEAKIEASELMPLLCVSCGGECEMVEETFDYAGTHCTNGMAGTHRTGVYVTNCCGAESIEGYPGWHVEYNQKPMPDRRHDYDYWHDDYDGAPDGNGLCGTADSVEAAIAEIGELDT